MTGPFLSIRLPPIGPTVAQLPATSQTMRLFVAALAVSTPEPTDVVREKLASPALARPVPLSVAVHASATLPPCHTPSGDAHTITGAVLSSQASPIPSWSASAWSGLKWNGQLSM